MIKMVLPFYIVFLLVVLLAPTATSTIAAGTAESTDQNALVSYDYMVLALTWPKSYCAIQKDVKKACKESNNVPTEFTIHGLWPNRFIGIVNPNVLNCSKDELVIKDLDLQIQRQALRDWPDIDEYKENATAATTIASQWFWKREWNKHGVCSNLNPGDYMALTLQRYQYLLPRIVKATNSLPYPRSPVNHEDFKNKIAAETRLVPKLVCKNLTQPPYAQYLVEIQFNMTNIPPYNLQHMEMQPLSSCVSSIPVYFPQQ